MEFAIKKGVSLSTLRRYIKADRIPYRIENGRYLLLDSSDVDSDGAERAASSSDSSASVRRLESKLNHVYSELQKAQEEIAELQTLIAFYEHSSGVSLKPKN
ncbi:MAG: hypothetical protein P4M08_02765 [Oligoflexia bacterium]|nr:hypothetical protein [Oligoflexia bacterium]